MTPEECIETCCVFKCINNPSNSKVNFFSFPEHRSRSYQRYKWVQAIKNINGRSWMPTVVSLVCGDHFVKGHPSADSQDTDYVPSIFSKKRKGSRIVTVKKFGLEYIKHKPLLEKPTRVNAASRNRAYETLAAAFGIPVRMVRAWERLLWGYVKEKMAEPPDKTKPSADVKSHWWTTVTKRLYANSVQRKAASDAVSPGAVVAALCAAARARGTLCSTPMYNDVRRRLRLTTAISDLHVIWVAVQRVALQQLAAAARAGDASRAAAPPAAAAVADLVLLHADVHILTDESVTLYEESAALHTLWQLVQRHRLEDAAPAHSRVRAQRWSRAHRSYIESGRQVSLVVLQRRWYELKQQACVRLAMHWRRRPGPQQVDDLTPADPAPDPIPREAYPRPAPLHIAILKRYPQIATGQFTSWRQLVLEGTIVTKLLEEENDVKESESNNSEQSTTTIDTGDDVAAKQLCPNMSKVEKPTFDVPMVEQPPDNDPLTEGPADTNLLKEENDIKEIRSNVSQQSTVTADTDADAAVKQLYPNMSKVEKPTLDVPMVEQPPDNDPFNEGPAVTNLLKEENDIKEIRCNVSQQSTVTADTDADAAVKQLYPNMSKVEKPTLDVPMVEQPSDNDPFNEGPAVTNLLKEENDIKEIRCNVSQQSTVTADTDADAAVKQLYPNMSKVEQPTVIEPKKEQTFYNVPLVEQSTADDQFAEHTTENYPLAEEPTVHKLKIEQPIDRGSMTDSHVAEQTTHNNLLVEQRTVDDPLPDKTTNSDLLAVQSTVVVPKIEQAMDYDLLNNRSTSHTLAESPVGHAGNAATEDIPSGISSVAAWRRGSMSMPDTQSGPNISSEQIHRAKVKSNEVIPPQNAYDTDTDTEDNLVIDECSNQTPYSHKLEPVPHTETHSFDTVSPHAALRCSAPTIEVLHMIDPNTVKTEILFESDDDDFDPCNKVDKDKIELYEKKEVSFLSNRIMFVDEPVVSVWDVKSEDDDTCRIDWENGQKMDDPVNDTPTIDPKLLMDTQVRLFRIDEIPSWIKNVRKDNSIRVSRIHRRYYTPKLKNVRKNSKKRTQNTRSDVELRTSARLTSTSAKTQEIKVDDSCLDKVANTHSIRQLCNNLKRELIDEEPELFEDEIPNKNAKTESDSDDDKPLLVLREGKPPRETTEVIQGTVVRQMVEESSSDDELLNDEMFNMLRVEERKRGRGSYYAASTIEWSAAFAPALGRGAKRASPGRVAKRASPGRVAKRASPGRVAKRASPGRVAKRASPGRVAKRASPGRVAKRVSLPDIESVRRHNSGMQVAQVAPITSSMGADGDDAMHAGQPLDDIAADGTPEAAAAAPAQHAETETWDDARERTHVGSQTEDLPTFHGHRDMPHGVLPSSRDKPLAWHELDLPADDELQAALDGFTAAPAAEAVQERSHCCAARRHREVNDSRRRIGLDEIPLHSHPDGMCTCCCTHLSDADARHRLDQQLRVLQQDIEQMLQKSAGARNHSKPVVKPSRSPSPARASTSATMATSAPKRAKKDGPSNTPTAAKLPKAKPVTYTNRSKKSRTRGRAAPAPAPAAPAPPLDDFEEWQRQKNMNAKYFHINSNVSFKKDKSTTGLDTAEQSTTTQATAVQSNTTRDTGVQNPIAQGHLVESTTAQSLGVESPTAQGRVVQSTTPQTVTKQSTVGQKASPPQNVVQPGLMPYIRQSRLISPQEEPRGRRAGPAAPRPRLNPVPIAPKPTVVRRATVHALHNTVVDALKEDTKNLKIRSYQSQATGSRRMNLTTEQVSEPTQPVQVSGGNSVPADKPVSILEEYSRTLVTEPVSNIPVVNALSLRVPTGPAGPQTTVVMAVTLPSDEVIKQTINRLYANDTVDLTEEAETSEAVSKETTTPNLVTAVKLLCMNPVNKNKSGRSLLKPVTATGSGRSLLKTQFTSAADGLQDTTDPSATRHKALKVMSLAKKLHDDDVIEIEDTDSNHSNSSDGKQSENSIHINNSSNPTLNANNGSNQPNAGSATESSDQSNIKPDESSNQAASNSIEAVSETSESASQAGTTNTTNQATDEDILSSKNPSKTKKSKKRNKGTMLVVFKRRNASEEAVSSHLVARPCSRIPVLKSLMDGTRRCPARFANVAAMTDFMATLRRAAAQADKEVYCHKWSAVEQPVSALPCGGTLLCVDGSRPPLVLPARAAPCARAAPHARAHLVLTDAELPCALPTYWTLARFGQMARVMPDELIARAAPEAAPEAAPGAAPGAARGELLTPREDGKICEKNHNFKILTAFCSADGIRQAARAGAALLLLSVLRARVVVLALRRGGPPGLVRHRASADVEEDLLRELEGLLDEAEIDEELGGRADISGDEEPAGTSLYQ